MVRYRRNFVAGGTYFFTATLVDRRSSTLIDHIGALRAAVRATRGAHPFAIDAVVVLPNHLHIVMTVARVRDWPYSSFHHYVRRGVLPEDWAGDLGQDRGSFGER
jgi:putative transposase